MNSKERCLAAIAGREVDRVPVFPLLMHLAVDRYGISYRRFVTEGDAMADAQLCVLERFGLDAVTACSDAFRIAADLGAEMVYPEDRPPYAPPLVARREDLAALTRPDPTAAGSRMADRTRAVAQMVAACGDTALVLGWVDLPFAEACSLCGVQEFMMMLALEPQLAREVLEFLTPVVVDFCRAQLAAGAPMIGCGDAAASLISPEMFREFALPFEQQVFAAIHGDGGLAKLHICGNTGHLLGDMLRSGADLFNVDHLVDFDRACEAYGTAGKCFKGNLDPVNEMMMLGHEACAEKCRDLLRRAAGLPYMLSGGCEVPQGISDETFAAFCEAPRAWERERRRR